MATITITAGSLSRSKTISATDLDRVLAALKMLHGQSLTNADVFNIVCGQFFNQLRDTVRTVECQIAAQAAMGTIVDVTMDD